MFSALFCISLGGAEQKKEKEQLMIKKIIYGIYYLISKHKSEIVKFGMCFTTRKTVSTLTDFLSLRGVVYINALGLVWIMGFLLFLFWGFFLICLLHPILK